MTWAVVAIFCLTYVLIAVRRLSVLPIGRPAGAMIGAILMVVVGALSPAQAYAAVDHDTLVLLFGTMALTAYLSMAGFFDWIAAYVVSRAKTPLRLLFAVAASAGILSAILVNDTVCVFMTPLVVAICQTAALPYGPYLIALATSANIGSAATLVGNPQNMIIGSMSHIGFATFLAHAGPAAAAGLILNLGLLWVYYRRQLPAVIVASPSIPAPRRREIALVGAVSAAVVAGYFAGFHMGFTTLAGVALLVIADRDEPREVFARIDWTLLVFFCGLFVVVGAFSQTGLVEQAWKAVLPAMRLTTPGGIAVFSSSMTLGSNIVSNVPLVLLVGPHLGALGSERLGWVLLSFASTVAGNLTLIGSVANVIVAERSKGAYALGFVEYLRFGLVSTVLVLATGIPLVCWAFTRWP